VYSEIYLEKLRVPEEAHKQIKVEINASVSRTQLFLKTSVARVHWCSNTIINDG